MKDSVPCRRDQVLGLPTGERHAAVPLSAIRTTFGAAVRTAVEATVRLHSD